MFVLFLILIDWYTGLLVFDKNNYYDLNISTKSKLACLCRIKFARGYLYTFIICHKFCSMQSSLNKLTLQKKLQNVMKNNDFWTKK